MLAFHHHVHLLFVLGMFQQLINHCVSKVQVGLGVPAFERTRLRGV